MEDAQERHIETALTRHITRFSARAGRGLRVRWDARGVSAKFSPRGSD